MGDDAVWLEILEDARRYPSPHNSQPIKLRPLDATTAIVSYDLDLGLPAESFGIPFGHVCAGVFLESLRVVARAKGWHVEEELDLSDMDFDAAERQHPIARVRLTPHAPDAADIAALDVFRARRTSRRPYDSTAVGASALAAAGAVCAEAGHEFRYTADAELVRTLVRVNQATLFDDLRNDDVYDEIMTWLRFSSEQAAERADGLSAETMLVPGRTLRFAMEHRELWDAPVIGRIIRSVYLRTMRGVNQLGWIEGPFASPGDYLEAGRAFMKLWLVFTAHGIVLHPFGTVITNPRSHELFTDAVDANEGDGRMAWMLFRFGHSQQPPFAHRRPAAAMVVG